MCNQHCLLWGKFHIIKIEVIVNRQIYITQKPRIDVELRKLVRVIPIRKYNYLTMGIMCGLIELYSSE